METKVSFRQKVGILTKTLVYISLVLSLQLLHFTNGQCWPNGTYGLPRPASGCPDGYSFEWETGSSVFSDDVSNRSTVQHNLWSSLNNESSLHFCMKLNSAPYCNDNSSNSSEWPAGCYCILKKGDCPENFRSGIIHWNESTITNGTLPDGTGNASIFTNIEFCCRCDGSSVDPIVLPTDRDFYLMALYPQCQLVLGMEARLQYVIWYSSQNESNYIQSWTPAYYDFNREIVTLFCYYARNNTLSSTLVETIPPLTSVTSRTPTNILETMEVTDETTTSETKMATSASEPAPSLMTSQAAPLPPNDLDQAREIGISAVGGFVGGIVIVLLLLLLCCVPICFKVRWKKKNEYYVTSPKKSMWVTSPNTPGVGTLLNSGYAIPMTKNPGYAANSVGWSRERSNEVKFNYF